MQRRKVARFVGPEAGRACQNARFLDQGIVFAKGVPIIQLRIPALVPDSCTLKHFPHKNLASSAKLALRQKPEDYEKPFDRRAQRSQSLSFEQTLALGDLPLHLFGFGRRVRWGLRDLGGKNQQPKMLEQDRGHSRTIQSGVLSVALPGKPSISALFRESQRTIRARIVASDRVRPRKLVAQPSCRKRLAGGPKKLARTKRKKYRAPRHLSDSSKPPAGQFQVVSGPSSVVSMAVNPQPSTLNSQLSTLNPEPSTFPAFPGAASHPALC